MIKFKMFFAAVALTATGAAAQPLDLPFADSFAGATIDPEKWTNESVNGTDVWQAAAKAGQSIYGSNTPSVDNDGGVAYFNSYSISKQQSARLMTPELSVSSSTDPMIEFYLWRYAANNYNDCIKLQIQVDGGEWQDIINGDFYDRASSFNTADADENGWYNCKVGFGNYLPEGSIAYRIGFLAVSDNGYNMCIDNVTIKNIAGADLVISSLVAPESLIAGNDLELVLNIVNEGAAVSAEDYSIEVESDFPAAISFESVDLPAMGKAKLTAVLPVTAEEAYDLEAYKFSAKIIFDADEVPDNNISDEVAVQMAFSESKAPQNMVANLNDEETESVTLSWDPVKDPTYTPINFKEDFNDLEKGAQGNFNGWVSIDLDKTAGEYHYNIGDSQFTVTNGGTPSGGNGNYLGVTIKSGNQQNDWLISPLINCKEDSEMTFEARIACKNVSSSYNIHFELLYSEDDEYDAENPALTFKNSLKTWSSSTYGPVYQNATFNAIKFEGIPSTARYVALHFDTKTNYDMAIWVDDLWLHEDDTTPLLGYHVYERYAGRLNAEAIADTEFTHVNKAKAVDDEEHLRYFYVTAIYPDGESAPSNLSNGIVTEVENILASGANIAPVTSGVMISGHNGELAEVYSLDGKKVTSMRCSDLTVINLPGGVYIVKVASDNAKIIVK